MKNLFRVTKWSAIIWIVIFLIFPLPFKGACLAVVGAYCPAWTIMGGLGYLVGFFDYLITAIAFQTLPALPLIQDAVALIPWILVALISSWIVTVIIFLAVRWIRK